MASSANGAFAQAEPPPGSAEAAAGAPADTPGLKARIDRYGAILAKAFDLAEAGVSLGLTVIGAVGAAAHRKIVEGMAESEAATPAGPPATGFGVESPAPAAAPETAPYGITNRLPLTPGAPLNVSFSINNDSALAPREVVLAVEAFAGERTGAPLSPGAVVVAPGAAAIAPMDFEKFVLLGAIPPETPPDVYHGSVSVGGEGGFLIPVRLVVEQGGGAPGGVQPGARA